MKIRLTIAVVFTLNNMTLCRSVLLFSRGVSSQTLSGSLIGSLLDSHVLTETFLKTKRHYDLNARLAIVRVVGVLIVTKTKARQILSIAKVRNMKISVK